MSFGLLFGKKWLHCLQYQGGLEFALHVTKLPVDPAPEARGETAGRRHEPCDGQGAGGAS